MTARATIFGTATRAGQVIAALNICVHAAETPMDVLTEEYLPLLLQTAGAISADWAACQAVPHLDIPRSQAAAADLAGQLVVQKGLR